MFAGLQNRHLRALCEAARFSEFAARRVGAALQGIGEIGHHAGDCRQFFRTTPDLRNGG